MSTAPPFGFSGGGPGAPAPQQAVAGFVLNVPADPNWEPFQSTDVLEKDGYYCGRIVSEKARNDQNKAAGVFFEFQLVDPDVVGKRLMKFLPDPNTSKGNTWWLWRGLLRSITGSTDHGKGAFQYALGNYANQLVYFKTEAYLDDGAMRTGVGDWLTKTEYDAAVAANRHRWPAKAPQPNAGAGALPGGLPGSFPGGGLPMGGPGAPSPMGAAPTFPPQQPMTPQPGAAPMQAAPSFPPAPTAPQQQWAPPPQQQSFPVPGTFAPPPATAPAFAPPTGAPPAPFGFVPQNGAPQPPPTAAGLVGSFPPAPGR